MHRPLRLHRGRRLAGATLALVVLTTGAAAAVPPDPYAPYQPQTTCSPHAKPGTVQLSRWLQRQYPGTGSMGISRSCRDGGVSEHKEGRAFDWAADVHSARDRASVRSLLHRLFATDAAGNRHALARRMGIMYLIWNDRIYSSSYAFAARPYHGCRVLEGCSDTLRHRNHVHLSLSRAGGAGRTSWYTGGTAAKPAPAPTPRVLDVTHGRYGTVRVPADGRRTTTRFLLRKGSTYQVSAAGLYGYGADPAQVADASCRWAPATGSWTPYPSTAVAAGQGSLNLLVDGTRISATACHRRSHLYTRTVTPVRTRPLRLQVANASPAATGALTVLVSRRGADVSRGLPAYPTLAPVPTASAARPGTGLLSETVRVPAGRTVRTAGSLAKGASYRLTVDGTVGLGGAVRSDGRCLALRGGWHPQASLDRRFPGSPHGRLYVDGAPFTGRATAGATCAGRTHVLDRTAGRTGRLELAVWDPLSRRDDTGSLRVRVQRLTPLPTPVAAAPERPARTGRWRQARDTVTVRASAAAGALSRMRLRAGEAVDVVVRGSFRSGAVTADASCVRTPDGWRGADRSLAVGQDPYQLWVDGHRGAWRPTSGRSACSATHAYRTRVVAAKAGPLRLAVLDLDHRDDTGTLRVTLTRRT